VGSALVLCHVGVCVAPLPSKIALANLYLLFVYLAFFRASPAEVPAGRGVLGLAIAFSVLANSVVTYTWYGLPLAAVLSLLEIGLSGAFLYGCLHLRGKSERWQQSWAALCGISAVMALVAWPWALALSSDPLPAWVGWAQWLLVMWSLLIWSRILRLAGDFPPVASALLALAYFFLSVTVFSAVVPPSA